MTRVRPMGDYSFLRSGRWAGLIAVTVLGMVVCTFLGVWQFGRHQERSARLDVIDANWNASAITVDELLAGGLSITPDIEWQRVAVSGEFVPGSAVTLRNRPVSGSPALHLLGIFKARATAGDVAILVDTGWVPSEAELPPLPTGLINIELRIRVSEPPGRGGEGWVTTLNPADAVGNSTLTDELAATPILQGYGLNTAPPPPLAGYPEPDRVLGNNLSYAFQWWLFAVGLPIGIALLARREARDEFALAVAGVRPRKATAEDEEDAIIDAQLR